MPPPPCSGGIKLHIELSLLLGTLAQSYLALTANFYTHTWTCLGPAALTAAAAAAAVGGASWGCAAAADVLLLLLAPLVGVYVAAAALYSLQLRCLAATWRLIRGKQKVCATDQAWRQTEGVELHHAYVALEVAALCCHGYRKKLIKSKRRPPVLITRPCGVQAAE